MDMVFGIFVLAIVIEALVQVIKGWIPENVTAPAWVWYVTGAAMGIAFCILANLDFLKLVGIQLTIPWVGNAVTGLAISRGASFFHDLWGKINMEKKI